MFRTIICLALFAALATAGETLIPIESATKPDSVAVARAAAVDGYLGEQRAERAYEDQLVSAAAGGGVFGWISIRVHAWFPTLDGDFRADGNDISISELGLDEEEITILPELVVTLGALGIRFDGFMYETQGSATITREITFGGVTFDVDEDVDSEIKIDNYRLLSILPIIKTSAVEIFLQAGISVFEFDGMIQSDSGSAREDVTAPVPVVGIFARAKIGPVLLEVDVSGLIIDYDDIDVSTLDARISIGFQFLKVIAVRAGYRVIQLDGDVENVFIDATLDGFFVGASLEF